MTTTKLEKITEGFVNEAIAETIITSSIITTMIVLVGIVSLRLFLIYLVKGKKEILDKEQRRWINRINNGTSVFGITALIFIWSPQLHTLALSLTAVAVAVVLITKELLMCLTGGLLRMTTKPFDVGHWISVDGELGEVLKITAMATEIQEIDTTTGSFQFTGRSIQIPNSKFLSVNVGNANFQKNHIYKDIKIHVQFADLDSNVLTDKLKAITELYFEPFRDTATVFNKKVERKAGVDFADPEPQFFLKTTDAGNYVFTVRLFIPTQKAIFIETDIIREFLSFVCQRKNRTDKKQDD